MKVRHGGSAASLILAQGRRVGDNAEPQSIFCRIYSVGGTRRLRPPAWRLETSFVLGRKKDSRRAFETGQLPHPTGILKGKTMTRTTCQFLSIWVSESVILGGSRATGKVTVPHKVAENAGFAPKGASDFRHLGLWPLECDSRCELVIQPNSQTETRII